MKLFFLSQNCDNEIKVDIINLNHSIMYLVNWIVDLQLRLDKATIAAIRSAVSMQQLTLADFFVGAVHMKARIDAIAIAENIDYSKLFAA